ncbi:MAG: hypothetical protein U9N78_09395, partial [Actinomycetota bacterium]|nr:hypothetical protein [Actinomycetota bacterium]
MARKKQEISLPGNDGRWFLELAGIIKPAPSPTETYTELEELEEPPAFVASESAAVTAGAAAVSGSLSPETNGEATEGDTFVPVAPRTDDGLDGWQPDEVSPRLGRRGLGRWLVAVLLVLAVAALVAAAVLLPRAVQTEADALAADYSQSLTDLRNELPDSQDALATLTDPTSTPEAISASVPAIGDLNTRGTVVISHATAPLPPTLAFVPRGPLEALEPTRTTMLILGAEAEGISGRLATTFTYHSTIPALFSTPELPVEADSATTNALSVSLAESLADTARLVADLPPDPTFDETRDLATQASERYAPWQLEYLDALREGDTERAADLIVVLDAARDDIEASMDRALGVVRTEVDPRIVTLAGETEAAINDIP